MNILVTRPKHQAESLCQMIERHGWSAIQFPTLEIVAVDSKKIKQQFDEIKQYSWLIFISTNAVNFAVALNSGKIDCFEYVQVAAVGQATKKALISAGIKVDLVPQSSFNTEGLLATKEMSQIQGKACLIIRGVGGREVLAQRLRARGAKIDYMDVYSREIPVDNKVNVSELLEQGVLDAITITSGDALKNLLIMVDNKLQHKLLLVPLIVISERIKVLAQKFKFQRIAVTEMPSDAAILKTAVMSLALNN